MRLREAKEVGRIRNRIWVDRNDMVADTLTKLTESKSTLNAMLEKSWWEPTITYLKERENASLKDASTSAGRTNG